MPPRRARRLVCPPIRGGDLSGLIQAPGLALAPAFYLHSAEIREAIGSLSHSFRWDRYFEKMGVVIGEAVRWVEALDRQAAQ